MRCPGIRIKHLVNKNPDPELKNQKHTSYKTVEALNKPGNSASSIVT